MIFIGFALRNPWSRRHHIVVDRCFPVSKNKTVEVTLYENNDIIGFSFTLTVGKRDHKGFSFELALLGYNIECMFYDNRHYGEIYE